MPTYTTPTSTPTEDEVPPASRHCAMDSSATTESAYLLLLSDMSDSAIAAYLIVCAEECNEAAKRNDMEGVHRLIHAECAALIEIRNRFH